MKQKDVPEHADMFAWDSFIEWCEKSGVETNAFDDVEAWWDCWKTAYVAAINGK